LPSLCDVNVLLAICYSGHQHHTKALAWLETQENAGSVLICRVVHLSLLRLINNPTVMGRDARTGKQAWEVSDRLLADGRFAMPHEPSGIEAVMRPFSSSAAFTPKVWQDAYLAAFAMQGDFLLVTFDAGLGKFKGLSLRLLS
jgi:hypothetical protein